MLTYTDELQRTKYTDTHTKESDCINLKNLVVIVYRNFAKCYHFRKLGKAYMAALCIPSYNFM